MPRLRFALCAGLPNGPFERVFSSRKAMCQGSVKGISARALALDAWSLCFRLSSTSRATV